MPWDVSGSDHVFVEPVSGAAGWPLITGYDPMNGRDLIDFYPNVPVLTLPLGRATYVVPGTMSWWPQAMGVLGKETLRFIVISEPVGLEPAIDDYTGPVMEAARKSSYTNGDPARLLHLSPDGVGALQPAKYYQALATNFYIDHRPPHRADSLRKYLQGHPQALEELRVSRLVNHLGVVCMVESADGMLVALNRSDAVAFRQNTLSASASGMVDFVTDVRPWPSGGLDLATLAHSAFRETIEELQVQVTGLRFLGLLREFLRGGKPEMYFYARSPLSFRSMEEHRQTARGRSESRSILGFELHSDRLSNDPASRLPFEKRVQDIIEESTDWADFTFVAGCLLAARHLMAGVA